jgi:hypothetical protein
MFFTPPQRFSVIAECFDFELIALSTRNRNRIAIVRSTVTSKRIAPSLARYVMGLALTKFQFNIGLFPVFHRRPAFTYGMVNDPATALYGNLLKTSLRSGG